MTITLSEFYANISLELRRGSSLDSQIPAKVRQGLKWIESQHTFLHMEHYASVPISSQVSSPRAIAQPPGFKQMLGWRVALESGYYNIKKVDFYDVDRVVGGNATAYWQDGKDYFWLDNTPDVDYVTEMAYTGYTIIGEDADLTSNIVNNMEGLLLAETMILFAPQLRDPTVKALYTPIRDEMMKALIDADVEERQSWQGESTQYGYEFREQINSEGNQS